MEGFENPKFPDGRLYKSGSFGRYEGPILRINYNSHLLLAQAKEQSTIVCPRSLSEDQACCKLTQLSTQHMKMKQHHVQKDCQFQKVVFFYEWPS